MKRLQNLKEISDGRIYDIKDMVKADAGNCYGCSSCCYGVGDLVELNPFDIYQMINCLKLSFDELIGEKIELRLNDKIYLPYLKMYGDFEKCSFLNEEERCSIHSHRPNICRLFPLGRVYEKDDFKYFLQVGACIKPNLGKVKVKKWIGIANYNENKRFILAWYEIVKALAFRLKFVHDNQELYEINEYFVDSFYRIEIKDGEDFYSRFFNILPEAKNRLGII